MTDKRFLVFVSAQTTGFPDFQAPSDAEHQPHIVHLAAIKVDAETREVVEIINSITNADGWEIPQAASDVHGITTNHAREFGTSERDVVNKFALMIGDVGDSEVFAHSAPFIGKVIRTALKRYHSDEFADAMKDRITCTAKLTKDIVQIPAAKSGFKNPTLEQALFHFTGEVMGETHNAIVCANAVKRVYFAYVDLLKQILVERTETSWPDAKQMQVCQSIAMTVQEFRRERREDIGACTASSVEPSAGDKTAALIRQKAA